MSRTRNALTIAAFNYGQWALSLLVSFAITPYIISRIGEEQNGAFRTSLNLFGYAALADLGVFGIYPWLVAEADGRKDEPRLRALIGQGPWLGLAAAGLYAIAAGGL
ncbi:MAG TPA: hypothetical protein VND93_16560, partial [Myxococcales bacterium]|nr:hypothetical protein [Myxococcales bacterium]